MWVDLAPCLGSGFGPFEARSAVLLAEELWLTAHVQVTGELAAKSLPPL